MRILLLASLFILSFSSVSAQTISDTILTNTHSTTDTSIVYLFCEVMPTFKTKEYKSFGEYLAKHIIYPDDAKALGISGVTYVEFVIEIDGSVSNVRIVKGKEFYPSCDQEAIRVISNSPKWNSGIHYERTIRVKIIQKISFNLKSK